MKVISIAAIAENNGIGKDNRLLWRLPEDMRFFRETTLGHPIITGRKNYESIPEKFRPLPGRENIVITRQKNYNAPGAKIFHSLNEAIESLDENDTVFIIGGGEIYRCAHENNLLDELIITHVKTQLEADTFYPEIDDNEWTKEILHQQNIDEKHNYSFDIIKYVKLHST